MTDLHARFLAQAFEDEAAPLVGTASKDGDPQVSPKGTVAVFDPETRCAFWERSYRSSFQAIEEGIPKILVYCRNPKRTKELPFPATARCVFAVWRAWRLDEATRQRVWDLSPKVEQVDVLILERKGVAILIPRRPD